MPRSGSTRLSITAMLLVAVVAGCGGTAAGAPSVVPSDVPTPTVTPSGTVAPGYGVPPEGWPTPRPISPSEPLPDPAGSPLPAELVGRAYNTYPPQTLDTQLSVLTLRGADDPHCVALYEGRSTCFTILWTPNWPKHADDPAARGSARIVDGNLVLGFDLVPFDVPCEGKSSSYAVSDDLTTLTGVDTACAYPGFVAH